MSNTKSKFADYLKSSETILWEGHSNFGVFIRAIKNYLALAIVLFVIILMTIIRQDGIDLGKAATLLIPIGIVVYFLASFKKELYAISNQRLLIIDSKQEFQSYSSFDIKFIKPIPNSGVLYFSEVEEKSVANNKKHIRQIGFRHLIDLEKAQKTLQEWYLSHREGELQSLQKDYSYTKAFKHDATGVSFSAPTHWPLTFYNLRKKPKYIRDFHLKEKNIVSYDEQNWNTVAIRRKTGTFIMQIQAGKKTRLKGINKNLFSRLLQLTGLYSITTNPNLKINSFSGLRSELRYGGTNTNLHRDYFLQHGHIQVIAGIHFTALLPGDIRQFDGIINSLDTDGSMR